MRFFGIDHFFNKNDAIVKFEQLKTQYNLAREKDDPEFFRKAVTDTISLGLKTDNFITTLEFYLPTNQTIPSEFFTIIYEEEGLSSLKQDKFNPNVLHLTHQFNSSQLDELYTYLSRISLTTFLINHSYGVCREEYQKLADAVNKNRVSESILPDEIGLEHLQDIETALLETEKNFEYMGTHYTRIQEYYTLADLHYTNLLYDIKDLDEKYGFSIDLRQIYVKIQEMKYKYELSKIHYTKWRDKKDILLGHVETENLRESLKLRKQSLTIEQAAIAIEAFIVYVYTFHIWDLVNHEGFIAATTFMKFFIPLLVALGAVLLVESLKNFHLYYKNVSKTQKTLIIAVGFFIFSIVLLSLGFFYINQ